MIAGGPILANGNFFGFAMSASFSILVPVTFF